MVSHIENVWELVIILEGRKVGGYGPVHIRHFLN